MTARARARAVLVVCAVALAACSDDDAADDAVAESATSVEVREDDEEPAGGTDGSSTTTTSAVPDATAEDPPSEQGIEGEGMGDPVVYVADLTGGTEVPGPGDPGGSGRTEIESGVEGQLCFDMVASGLDSAVTDAHVHEGAAGASGDVVIPIGPPTATDGGTSTWTDVCVAVDDAVGERLEADPSAFYANIHTETFPGGAVRGQLERATIFDLTLS